ncbi:substrate-binding domain-containing protein [Oerskovia sp. M15]
MLLLDDKRDRGPLVRYLSSGHVDAAVVVLQRSRNHSFATSRSSTCRSSSSAARFGDGSGPQRRRLRSLRRRASCRPCPPRGGSPQAGDDRRAVALHPSTERLRGFRDELAEWGLRPELVVRGDYSLSSGSVAAAQILRRAPDLDGLFGGSDLMAVGAMRVLAASNRRVPEDVSVVGFDDTVVAETSDPPLTSVRQPLRELGERAAEIVLEALQVPGGPPRHESLPTTLTVRQSV